MPDLFDVDREVVTYSSDAECIEKVKFLLEHDDIRRKIAGAGQKRTLRDHTVLNRCQQLDEVLQAKICGVYHIGALPLRRLALKAGATTIVEARVLM